MILNPGYETTVTSIAQPGIPADWTVTTLGTGEAVAVFTGDSAYAYGGYETFDHGWTDADPQKLILALTSVQSFGPEQFTLWAINQGVLFLSALESAAFTNATTSFENFDTWDAPDTQQGFSIGIREDFTWSTGTTLDTVATAMFAGATAELFPFRGRQEVQASRDSNTLSRTDGQSVLGSVNDRIYFIKHDDNASLPNPLSENFIYVIKSFVGIAINLKTAVNGDTVVLADSGVGTQWLYSDPAKFWVEEM